jgi:hypothetical protein
VRTAVVEAQFRFISHDTAPCYHLALLRRKFEGVRKNIRDDFFKMNGIYHQRNFLFAMLNNETDALDSSDALKLFKYMIAIRYIVLFFKPQFKLTRVNLSYVCNLLHDVKQTVAVAQHDGIKRPAVSILIFFYQLLQWRLNHSQR